MKKITGFLMGLAMLLSLTSCVTAVHAQDDTYFDGEADVSVIVTYGTPYIVNGMIEYYLYKGWYYYPYWTNDSYYFHRYRRPLPPEHFHSWYRPIPRHYHHPRPDAHRRPPHHNRPDVHHRPHGSRPSQPSRRPSNNIGMHGGGHHGNMGGRPSGGHRSSTRMGGRR